MRSVALAGIALLMSSCQEPLETPLADEPLLSLQADAVLYDMEDFLSINGVRSGLVRADTAYVFNDSSVVHMWGVEMLLFHADGQERAHVTGVRGRMNQRTEAMLIRGDVLLLLDGGLRKVESPELRYEPLGDEISSDSATAYTEGGRVTRGSCFRSDLDFQFITVCNIRGAADVGPGGTGRGRR